MIDAVEDARRWNCRTHDGGDSSDSQPPSATPSAKALPAAPARFAWRLNLWLFLATVASAFASASRIAAVASVTWFSATSWLASRSATTLFWSW